MMIELIKIKNYALIEDSEIDLSKGLNIVTGETGAGKSLFIGALSLILGEKGSKNIIGKHGEEAVVEVIIKDDRILKKIKELDLEVDGSSILIKRVFGEKNRCYVNGQLVSQNQLKELMKGSIDICSQHENQSILEKSNQLDMLDLYSEIDRTKLKELYKTLKDLREERERLVKEKEERESKADYIQFTLDEIKKVGPTEEDEKIEEKIVKFKNLKKVMDIEESVHELFNAEDGLRKRLKNVYFELQAYDQIHNTKRADEFKAVMDQLLEFELKPSNGSDLEDINYYMERMEQLNKIKRKHGGTVSSLLAAQKKLEDDIDNIKNFDSNLSGKDGQIKKAEELYKKEANAISRKRKENSIKLSREIESHLKDLSMNSVKFQISLENKEGSETGIDDVSYLISPNKGEELLPLDEIASGGELSRVLLSIFNVLSNPKTIYLFDEVDAGIGGDVATQIGKKLKDMSKANQIICITHLPQVAVFSENHLKIAKEEDSKKTVSRINKLEKTQVEKEISRMLGSSLGSATALDHAREMIRKSKSL